MNKSEWTREWITIMKYFLFHSHGTCIRKKLKINNWYIFFLKFLRFKCLKVLFPVSIFNITFFSFSGLDKVGFNKLDYRCKYRKRILFWKQVKKTHSLHYLILRDFIYDLLSFIIVIQFLNIYIIICSIFCPLLKYIDRRYL